MGKYSAPQFDTLYSCIKYRLQRGLNVRLFQLGLSDRGVNIKADGIFGQTSQQLIKKYQSTHGLPVTGVADVAMIAQLVA